MTLPIPMRHSLSIAFVTLTLSLLPHLGMAQTLDRNGIERSPEEIKKAINVVEQRLKRQQGRASDLRAELIRLDSRIEKQVAQIVKSLESVGDSNDSRIRVAQTKGKVIEGLKKSITIYQQKRAQIRAQLVKLHSGMEKAKLEGDMEKFDQMSETRITQIMDLSKSLTTHEDYQKYNTYANSNYSDWGRGWSTVQEKNPDHQQNKSVTKITDKEKKSITAALQKSISDLGTQNRALKERLNSPNFANQKDLITEDIERNKQAITRREAQLESILTPSTPATTPISRRAAHEMELMIRDLADDIRRDFDTLFRRYSEFVKGRAQSNALTEQLNDLEEMLN